MSKIAIRPITLDDTDNIVRWRNLYSVRKNLYSQAELTPEQHIAYYKNNVESGKCAQFIIALTDDNNTCDIGTVFIKNIDYDNNNGEFGIFIGEETERGKGYAKLSTKLILEYGFESLNLHRIYLTVMADNIQAIRAYESSGFVKEGIMREEYLRNDGYVDIVIMGILKKDWDERNTNEDIFKTNNNR